MAATSQDYEVLVGLNYAGDTRRAEPGEIVSDLPTKSLTWLIEQGVVRPVPATPGEGGA